MKTILWFIGLGLLATSMGCEIEEHGHRGGYHGPAEYGHGAYYGDQYRGEHEEEHHFHPDWDDRD